MYEHFGKKGKHLPLPIAERRVRRLLPVTSSTDPSSLTCNLSALTCLSERSWTKEESTEFDIHVSVRRWYNFSFNYNQQDATILNLMFIGSCMILIVE